MIELVNLYKSYAKGKINQVILNGINLKVVEGEKIAIMGRSGTGKSTLLHILAGMEKVTNGKYLFKGRDTSELSYKKLALWRKNNIGFILQNHVLIEEKNIFDNVALPLLYANKTKSEINAKVMPLLNELGIAEKAKHYPYELSGGQSQRVAIARALINNPNLILADEPTGSLDEETEQVVLKLFNKINTQGKTIILVTHDGAVARTCNRIISMKEGQLEEVEYTELQ